MSELAEASQRCDMDYKSYFVMLLVHSFKHKELGYDALVLQKRGNAGCAMVVGDDVIDICHGQLPSHRCEGVEHDLLK